MPIAIPIAIAVQWRPPQPITMAQKLPLLASLYLLAPLLLWGIAIVQKQPFSAYGLVWKSSVLRSMGLGWLGGVAGLALMFAIEWILGWVKWQYVLPIQSAQAPSRTNSTLYSIRQIIGQVLPILLLGVWVSFTEELVFRGFLLNVLQLDYAPWASAAIASFIFAALHLVWEGRETLPQLPGLWLMGMVLVLARWVEGGSLGLAIGLHAGWIWAIASLDTTQILKYTDNGSQWITGLEEKPLAGIMGLTFLLTTAAVLKTTN